MDARIEAVRVAGTPEGPLPVVLIAVEEEGAGTEAGEVDGEETADEGGPVGGGGGEPDAAGALGEERAAADPGDMLLPIFIGFDEAISIARGLDATDIGRPLTHDLTLDIVEELGGRVDRAVVTDVRDNTYIADLHLNTPREDVVIDARPSDALALAARTDAPIEVAREVFEDGRRAREEFEDLEDIREVADLYE